jgi:hypothetical protein
MFLLFLIIFISAFLENFFSDLFFLFYLQSARLASGYVTADFNSQVTPTTQQLTLLYRGAPRKK